MLSQLCQLSSSSNLHRINEPAKTKIMPKPWCHTHKHLKELANMQFGTPCLYIAAQLPHIARDAYSTDENNLRMHFAWDKFGQLSDTHKLTLESCMWSIQSSYCLDAAYLHQNQTYTTTPTHHLLSICAVPPCSKATNHSGYSTVSVYLPCPATYKVPWLFGLAPAVSQSKHFKHFI